MDPLTDDERVLGPGAFLVITVLMNLVCPADVRQGVWLEFNRGCGMGGNLCRATDPVTGEAIGEFRRLFWPEQVDYARSCRLAAAQIPSSSPFWSIRHGRQVTQTILGVDDPGWQTPTPPPHGNFLEPPRVTGDRTNTGCQVRPGISCRRMSGPRVS